MGQMVGNNKEIQMSNNLVYKQTQRSRVAVNWHGINTDQSGCYAYLTRYIPNHEGASEIFLGFLITQNS